MKGKCKDYSKWKVYNVHNVYNGYNVVIFGKISVRKLLIHTF